MFDTRYHFVYLIAIFLMLGFGILIGASYYGQEQVKQQTKAISALRDQVNGAVQDGAVAKDQLAKIEDALDRLRPAFVRGKLAGKRVIIIQAGEDANAVQDATTALSDSGASVMATVVLTDKLIGLSDTQQEAILPELAVILTKGVTGQAANQAEQQSLEGQGLITVTGSFTAPTNLFVIVSGSPDGADDDPVARAVSVDTPLIEQIEAVDSDAHIVGCETFTTAVSVMSVYQKTGIATVDCIDRAPGRLALPFALRGGAEIDNYGMKPTAARLIPASLEEQSAL